MKSLLIVLITIALLQPLDPSVNDAAMLAQQAELAYTEGDFQLSVNKYQQVVDAGVWNAEIFFNLGNAYYQTHDLGRALVNYRRAEQLIPRDDELRLNIARVRAQRIDPPVAEVGILVQIAQWTTDWFSNSEIGLLTLMTWWLGCGFFVVYRLVPKSRTVSNWGSAIGGVLFVLFSSVAGMRIIIEYAHPSAIVIVETVSVMTGPDAQYIEIFELHAGGEIRVVQKRNDWVRIQLPDLREGWVEAQEIEVI